MIKKSKQANFGENIFNTIEENAIKMAEFTLKLRPNLTIKRKQTATPSQRCTVLKSFAKTFWVLFRENIV